ncbi:ATPase, T2SS/T4P/T4SS family [Cupriavidus basilensis]
MKDAVAYAYNKLHADKTNNDAGFSTAIDLECMVPYDNGKESFNIRYTGTPMFGGFTVYLRYLFSKTTDWSSPQKAGYSPDQEGLLFSAMRARKGAISISGITGSGKSTTAKYFLESVDQLNGHRLNIITVEHPVEYKISGARQEDHPGNDPDAWRDVQRRLVREDPDAVFIGEVRCIESGQTAKIMNETGHLTLFTVHADSVLGVFNRLVDPTIGFTLGTLTMPNFWNLIVYQALVPTLCEDCKQPLDEQLPDLAQFLQDRFSLDTSPMRVRNEHGCEKCNHTGVAGVEVVAEMLQPTRAILDKIRKGEIFEAERLWRGAWDGRFDSPNMTGKTVFQHALYKAYLGHIDPRTVETFRDVRPVRDHLRSTMAIQDLFDEIKHRAAVRAFPENKGEVLRLPRGIHRGRGGDGQILQRPGSTRSGTERSTRHALQAMAAANGYAGRGRWASVLRVRGMRARDGSNDHLSARPHVESLA